MSNNMAKIAEARKTVEQLKLEVNIDRMKVLGRRREEGRGPGIGVWTGQCWEWGRELRGDEEIPLDPLRKQTGPGELGCLDKGAEPNKGWGVARLGNGRGLDKGAGSGNGRGPDPGRVRAAAELLAFCETHAKDDPLMTPVPAAENPFRDKRLFCVLL
ncbi:hypothetical protein CB1_000190009 [Camelus ferus]|nr:hypothetical protein CB1_000190009 [Camelus ferus]